MVSESIADCCLWLLTRSFSSASHCRAGVQLLQKLTLVQRITTVIIQSAKGRGGWRRILTCYGFFCIIVSGGERAGRVQNERHTFDGKLSFENSLHCLSSFVWRKTGCDIIPVTASGVFCAPWSEISQAGAVFSLGYLCGPSLAYLSKPQFKTGKMMARALEKSCRYSEPYREGQIFVLRFPFLEKAIASDF